MAERGRVGESEERCLYMCTACIYYVYIYCVVERGAVAVYTQLLRARIRPSQFHQNITHKKKQQLLCNVQDSE